MVIRGSCATILLSISLLATGNTPQARTSATVIFPTSGPVAVQEVIQQGDYPYLIFRAQSSGKLLLKAQVGWNSDWKEFIDKENPAYRDIDMDFVVLHRVGLPDPLIVAAVPQTGGSDCRYNSALFGEVNGKVTELTPALPDRLLRGEMLLSKQSSNTNAVLTVTSERYQSGDIHYTGPSRMKVYTYIFHSEQGKFVESRHTEIKTDNLHVTGENLMELFGELGRC